MTFTLTDDEVVAIAALRSSEFPAWLPTVARVPGEMIGGALRGARALLVRGLAEAKGDGLVVASEVADLIEPFVGSDWTCSSFSYATVASLPVAAGGVRVFATNADDEWHLDEVSAYGVHSIRPSTRAEFESHARAFADVADGLYPATGGLQNHTRTISVFAEGLAGELIVKAEDGFYLAGASGRDDLPLTVPRSEFAFKQIDSTIAAAHMAV